MTGPGRAVETAVPAVRSPLVDAYIRTGMAKVEGWMTVQTAELVAMIGDIQAARGCRGAVAEIGVHHGRLFILMALLRRPKEGAAAVDVFDRQELNVDRSGHGDRACFEANLSRHGIDLQGVSILAESSLELAPAEITGRVGDVRLFSIDGGHTAETTLNDLRLADATLGVDGVVLLDDVFNPVFPAVSVGLARFLSGRGRLIPFAVGREKVFLCRPVAADAYRLALTGAARRYYVRDESYFDHTVAIIHDVPMHAEDQPPPFWGPGAQRFLARSGAYSWIRTTSAFAAARPRIRRLIGR